MSEWKERANKRRDFRHTHGDTEDPIHRSKKTGQKPYVILCKTVMGDGDWVFNRYKNRKSAEKALKAKQTDKYYAGKLRIVGPGDE